MVSIDLFLTVIMQHWNTPAADVGQTAAELRIKPFPLCVDFLLTWVSKSGNLE